MRQAEGGEGTALRWIPTSKPVTPSITPVGRNPERETTAQAAARIEGLIKDAHASADIFSAATAGTVK